MGDRTVRVLLLLSALGWAASQGPAESPAIAALRNLDAASRSSAVHQFWADVDRRGAPLVEDAADGRVLITFVWRAKGRQPSNVVVVGALTGPNLQQNRMLHLEGTDLWYRTYRLDRAVRFLYRFSVDDDLVPAGVPPDPLAKPARFRRDPLNRRTYPAQSGEPWSVGEGPSAPSQPWVGKRSDVPTGDVREYHFNSRILGNERSVWIYTPPGYEPRRPERYPLLLLFDGEAYTRIVPTPTILDNLIADRRIRPIIAVFVGNAEGARNRELAAYDPFAHFLVRELMPWARGRLHITSSPADTVVAGSSFGALTATFVALRYPDLFGRVLSQSGSYWWAPDTDTERERLTREFATTPRLGIRFYLDVGTLEIYPTRNSGPTMLDVNRRLRDVLRSNGYSVEYAEFEGGHEYVNWQGTLGHGLIALVGLQTRNLK